MAAKLVAKLSDSKEAIQELTEHQVKGEQRPGLVHVCDPSQCRRSPFIVEREDESFDRGRDEGMRGASGRRGAVMMEKVLTGWREGEVRGGEGRGRGDICNIWKNQGRSRGPR